MFTNPVTNWAFGYNNAAEGNSIEFDVTQHGDHTLSLTWQSGEGNLGTLHTHRDIYLAQPTAAASPGRLPVTINSIKVNGVEAVGEITTHVPAETRWLVEGTVGTINPVTIPTGGGFANAFSGIFADAGLELRTFYLAANAFTIPSGATLEITYRVGTGNVTNIHDVETGHATSLQTWITNNVLHIKGLTIGQTYRIFNISGRLVYQGVATADYIETLSISSLSSGAYIIQSENKSGKFVW